MILDAIERSLREGFSMFWETLWPLAVLLAAHDLARLGRRDCVGAHRDQLDIDLIEGAGEGERVGVAGADG